MTRETKIGLLVGLGFIVVFAVLLSHTGTVPPPGDINTPALVQGKPPETPVLGLMQREIGKPEAPAADNSRAPGTSPESDPLARRVTEEVVSTSSPRDDLPSPAKLNPTTVGPVADAEHRRDEATAESPAAILGVHRTAPVPAVTEVAEPQPTPPANPPIASPPPEPVTVASAATPSSPAGKIAPSNRENPPREYTVQSGDTLTRIAEKEYKKADPKLVKLILKSNEGRLKDANTVVQGQKLIIPELPPEMFENAPGFDVRLAAGQGKSMSMEEFMNNASRKAPRPGGREAGKDTARTADGARAESARPAGKGEKSAKPAPTGGSETPLIGDLSKLAAATSPRTGIESAPKLKLGSLEPVRIDPIPGSDETAGSKDMTAGKEPATGSRSRKDARDVRPAGRDGKAAPPRDGREPALSRPSRDSKDTKDSRDARDTKALKRTEAGDQMYRVYEIRPNDTMGSIARRELGSSQQWQEIKKANGGLDPQKMKPGDRIRLPRKPVSTASDVRRVSA
jgi:nucleoid-associated protein YgaU